jgi:cysteinyl-tRNA synthetase
VGLVLTNTLSGRKEPLVSRKPGHVGIYWCGVTVYSRSHIGHARALITADVLCRYLRTRGNAVTFVRNFTDIEDKIIKRAREEGITTEALTSREIGRFNEDVAWLRCLRPTHEPRATTHIAEMLAMIEALIADGYAYPVPDGSVYFRVRRFADYGKLSHQNLDFMPDGIVRPKDTSRSGRAQARRSQWPDQRDAAPPAGTSSARRWRPSTWDSRSRSTAART